MTQADGGTGPGAHRRHPDGPHRQEDAPRQQKQDLIGREDSDLAPMNEEINRLVSRRGDRSVADLVPEVEVIMRRHGASPPGRDGIVQWISDAAAAAERPE